MSASDTIAVGSGLAAQIVVIDESTYGEAPSLSSGVDSFEMLSETLELKKTAVQGDGLAAGKVYERTARRVLTEYDVTGDLKMQLPTRNLGFWLRYMVGDFTETPSELSTSGVYQTVFYPQSDLTGHSFCLQKGVPATDATVEPFTYVGGKLTGWEISVATGGIGQLTLNIDARNELAGSGNSDPLNSSVPSLATFATASSGQGYSVFHFREATLYTGSGGSGSSSPWTLDGSTSQSNVLSASVKQSFSLDTKRYFLGGEGFKSEQIENGYRKLTGSASIEFLSAETLYNAFANDTTKALELKFVGPTVADSDTYLLDILIPNVKLEGESPKVSGPGVVKTTVNFTALDDETTTPLQITYQSEDSGT